MNVLILDGYNLMHRARSGFQLGDFNVVFNFFRSLKPLVEKFKPNRVYFTLEGHPKKRYELLPEYKANRVIDQTTEAGETKYKSLVDFRRQMELIVELLAKHFPVSVVQHIDFEADDVIYNLIRNASRAVEFTVVSSDSDFIQLLQEFPNVKLYNPITKKFVEAPSHDYILWKALRGDSSDNVPALVSEAEALRLVGDFDTLNEAPVSVTPEFSRNVKLIAFQQWSDEETKQMVSSEPAKDWSFVKAKFEAWGFQSMLKESYWDKFVSTFDALWG
jgi:5'-3' exonuclease